MDSNDINQLSKIYGDFKQDSDLNSLLGQFVEAIKNIEEGELSETDFLLPAVDYNIFVLAVGAIIEGEGYKYWPLIGADEEIKGISEPKSLSNSQAPFPQVEKVNLDNETATVGGICEGKTEKALLIHFESGKQIWIPKSTIRSEFDPESSNTQQFTIDTWVLKKNEVFV